MKVPPMSTSSSVFEDEKVLQEEKPTGSAAILAQVDTAVCLENNGMRLVDFGGVFLETGFSGAELIPGGSEIEVDIHSVERFVELASNYWFRTGIQSQVRAVREGISTMFPLSALEGFTAAELSSMVCGEENIVWDKETLRKFCLKPHDGLELEENGVFNWLIEELVAMDNVSRSVFLDFVTSCPRLPPGGVKHLSIDVFSDPHGGYPRSRACVNHLYLPKYTKPEVLRERLQMAMHSSSGHDEFQYGQGGVR